MEAFLPPLIIFQQGSAEDALQKGQSMCACIQLLLTKLGSSVMEGLQHLPAN